MDISHKKISVFAPASIGNVSVGFDILGLCVKTKERVLGDIIHVELSEADEFQVIGKFADVLPKNNKDNLVLKAKALFLDAYPEAKRDKHKLTLEKRLPICSGLGSSASSVVATIQALNELYKKPLSKLKCLKLMGQCEAGASGSLHYDNIAPSFLGGLTLCSNDENLVHHLPWPNEWKILLAYADIDIPTIEARKALPSQYDKKVLIEHSQNLAQFVHALHTHDLDLAAHSLTDLIAEPYRQGLLPNFATVKAKLLSQYGVKAVGISGSGPTVFAIVDNASNLDGARAYLQSDYVEKAHKIADGIFDEVLDERSGKIVNKTPNEHTEIDDRGFVILAEYNSNGAEIVSV